MYQTALVVVPLLNRLRHAFLSRESSHTHRPGSTATDERIHRTGTN
jgi:hypothetical protein